jgi:MinD-like ATPase involved in chromosome partitioning or flagellar assembly
MSAGDALKRKIEDNLQSAKIAGSQVNVCEDLHGGWRVAVISDALGDYSDSRRRELVLVGIDDPLSWLFLGTKAELAVAGYADDGLNVDQPFRPLWPQSLQASTAHTTHSSAVVLPSSLDTDISLPLTVTFYSLRGGVGRSTALAHTALILAAQGKKVVCLDMDLEAPGLAALFGLEEQVRFQGHGVASLLLALDMGEKPVVADHLVPVDQMGNLFLLPAGRIGPIYADTLSILDPGAWYREDDNPLRALLNMIRTGLPFTPDAILIDSRTGLTAMSAPLLFEQADLAIVVFFPHPQTLHGTTMLVNGLRHAVTYRDVARNSDGNAYRLRPESRFIASPLPAGESGERYRLRAADWVAQWLQEERSGTDDPEAAPYDQVAGTVDEVLHGIAYSEALASMDSISWDQDASRHFKPVAEWVLRFLPTEEEGQNLGFVQQARQAVLEELSFSTDTAERQDAVFFERSFLTTKTIRKALKPGTPLVIGRKGTGKTALFRYMLEIEGALGTDVLPCVVHAPEGLNSPPWQVRSDGFRYVRDTLHGRNGFGWKHFWLAYIFVALAAKHPPKTVREEFLSVWGNPLHDQWDFLKVLEEACCKGVFSPMDMERHLRSIDEDWKETHGVLLFDGLDTGFGNEPRDRETREHALVGLFSVLTEWENRLEGLSFKVMLREDIWRSLLFENKSHLFGRTAVLKWSDQAQFLKVILKQAVLSSQFQTTLAAMSAGSSGESEASPDVWSDARTFEAWNVLVGERMSGGKTAFTRNWVWSRLGDGNGDHSPRNLSILFELALEWEREEQQRTPYHRSIIRPRALMEQLPEVSRRALDALLEEFPELIPLKEVLSQVNRTPFGPEEISTVAPNLIDLGREVGLLIIHEGLDGAVVRYTVPEVYRWGLGMGRKGPV